VSGEIEVLGGDPAEVVFGAEGRERTLQQVRTVLGTRVGTVPLDREFGLSMTFLDQPLPRAQALLTAEIIRQLRRYVPGIEVTSVELVSDPEGAADGRLIPKVRFKDVSA